LNPTMSRAVAKEQPIEVAIEGSMESILLICLIDRRKFGIVHPAICHSQRA
jgi:hypothetical protein